jgi:hypothetical protein
VSNEARSHSRVLVTMGQASHEFYALLTLEIANPTPSSWG